ncbi:hypothetical protein ACM66B_003689 [Microbotryomycetes sp. NB124-2]
MAFWRQIPIATDVLTDQREPAYRRQRSHERGRSNDDRGGGSQRSRSKSVSGRFKHLMSRSKSRSRAAQIDRDLQQSQIQPFEVGSRDRHEDDRLNLSDAQLAPPERPVTLQERRPTPSRQQSIFREGGHAHERPRFEPLVNLMTDNHSAVGMLSDTSEQLEMDRDASGIHRLDMDRSRANESPRPPSYHSPVASEHAPAGIANLGNTCYMAAVLQALSVIEEVSHLLPGGDFKSYLEVKGTKGPLCKATARLLQAMSRNVDAAVAPSAFHRTFCAVRPEFNTDEQFDAQEFFTMLLESLHDELNQSIDPSRPTQHSVQEQHDLETLPESIAARTEWQKYLQRNDSPIADLFTGQFRNRVRCQTCGTTSTTFDLFQTLSLPIAEESNGPVELAECFNALLEAELLEGENAWSCPRCQRLQAAAQWMSISRLPPVLVIHFRRFSSLDYSYSPIVTQSTPIDISVTDKLDLSDVLPKPASDYADRFDSSHEDETIFATKGNAEFELCAIVKHEPEGQAQEQTSSGHYTAVINVQGQWFEADDEYVSSVDIAFVKQFSEGAYLLFYRWLPR